MIDQFNELEPGEIETMFKVPILVSILIAGADNNIDKAEMKKAVSISKFKQKKARRDLIEYYKVVGSDFEDKFKVLIQHYPVDAEDRNPQIVEELKKVNLILPKLDKNFAVDFYQSVRDIARKVAEASGGVLGYMAVGYEESKFIGLDMIKDPSN
ncbi:MAG: hypothetical protein AAGG59_05595 [Bacteroidota bacterium]